MGRRRRTLLTALWLSVLLVVVTVGVQGAHDTVAAPQHRCIHDRIAVPLHALPHALVVTRAQAAAHSPHNATRPLPATPLAQTHHAVPLAVGGAGEGATRPVKIQLIYALQDACRATGDTVPTYQGSQQITCSAADVLTDAKRAFMTAAITRASAFLSRALRTSPTASMQVAADVCTGPHTAATVVADTDFVLVVTAAPGQSAENSPVAWARACATCGAACVASNKPVVGMINLLPATMMATMDTDLYVHVVMHEMSHALGFSSLMSTLDRYVDLDGEWHSSGGTLPDVNRPGRDKLVQLVRTPRVLAAARRHFACDTLDGVEVEDLGGEGSAGSHWKKRIFGTEALTGALTSGRIYYSAVTLAMFADAGFYEVDFGVAEDNFAWGYHAGCNFLLDTCRSLVNAGRGDEFCFVDDGTNGDVQRCTHDRMSVGHCDVTHYKQPLQSQYRYFDDIREGGSLAMMDYCPFIISYSNSDCVTSSAGTSLPKFQGSEFGPHSRCFVANTITSGLPVIDKSDKGARCFPAACNAAGQLLLRVQGQTVPCPASGEAGMADTSRLIGVHGTIQCPAAQVICGLQNSSGLSDLPRDTAVSSSSREADFVHSALNFSVEYGNATRRSSCAERAARCQMPSVLQHYPVCRSLAEGVLRCFGTDCAAPVVDWLAHMSASTASSSNFPQPIVDALQRASCGAAGRLRSGRRHGNELAQRCLDGESGAQALCALVSDSSFAYSCRLASLFLLACIVLVVI